MDRTKKDADPGLRAAVLNNLGNLFESQKKYDQAAIVYRDVAVLARQAGNKELSAKAQVNLARATLEQGDAGRAAVEMKGVLSLVAVLPDSHEKAAILIQAGQLFSRINKIQKKSGGSVALGQAYKSLMAAQKVAGNIGAAGSTIGGTRDLVGVLQAGRQLN